MRRIGRFGIAVLAAVLVASPAFGLTTVIGTVTLLEDQTDAGGATLTCPEGTRVVSGGFESPLEAYAATNRALGPRTWRVEVIGLEDPETNLHPFAYCSKRLRVTTVSSTKAFGEEGVALTVTARCPLGKVAVGGGWQFSDHSTNNSVFWSRPTAKWRGWQIRAFAGNADSITAYARCVKKGKLDLRLRTRSKPVAANAPAGVSVSCRVGEELLSGGFGVSPKPDWNNTTGPDLFYSTSKRVKARGWTVQAWNYSDVGGNVVAHVVCRR